MRVVAAVILQEGKVLATQRGHGAYKGWWEFPGGKIEKGETPEEALVREIREELDAEIEVLQRIDTVEYDYPVFHLTMDCFLCRLKNQKMELLEHASSQWLTAETLHDVTWLPADEVILKDVMSILN